MTTVAVTLFLSHRQIRNIGYKNLIGGVGERLLYIHSGKTLCWETVSMYRRNLWREIGPKHSVSQVMTVTVSVYKSWNNPGSQKLKRDVSANNKTITSSLDFSTKSRDTALLTLGAKDLEVLQLIRSEKELALNKTAQTTCIRIVRSSNTGRDTEYPDRSPKWISSAPEGKFQDTLNYATTKSFHTHSSH
jgi:hypothetical protein